MFTDTHCHLSHLAGRGENLSELIDTMAEHSYPFVLDIGTEPGDFDQRVANVRSASGGEIPSFVHFSAGLWPSAESIADRKSAIAALEDDIVKMLAIAASRGKPDDISYESGTSAFRFAALGECGLDRYWNGPPAAERRAKIAAGYDSEAVKVDGPGTTDLAGEEELFAMQIELAKKYRLPVIVHSRDAADATLGCVKNGGWDLGVIHCFSYGTAEARAFLDRGWYISFPGNITWAKKEVDIERIATLVRYIPRDRFLLETDAPYLAPAPYRGKTCTPLMIEKTYARAAAILGMTSGELAILVCRNARELFAVRSDPVALVD